MAPERHLFANFERMRREMDELFGDVFQRSGLARRQPGFSPPVDVYYCSEPPKVVIKAELAGIDPDALGLEIQGRELMMTGLRRPAETEGRVYQQLEIEHGPFRRVIALGVDVRVEEAHAVYEDGFLRVELPVVEREPQTRQVPIDVPDTPPDGVNG